MPIKDVHVHTVALTVTTPHYKRLHSLLDIDDRHHQQVITWKMKPSMIHSNGVSLLVLLAAGIILFEATTTYAAPHSSSYPGYYSPLSMEGQNPEYLLQTIARLRQALIADDDLENSKRGLDLGLGRGFSGSQAAKHLMGLAAANFAGGPGRRRRSEEEA
ncbi:diuretic hormone class 2 isoform X3 [Tenebrio molitor]|uniref:diuretic hormone class 2 isoform X3 n=1 Tax=Tenebrio molitor TaxID=7067 RepID=UPI00362472E4